jgi:hypothetical protein
VGFDCGVVVLRVVDGGDVAVFDDGMFGIGRALLCLCPVCFELVFPIGHAAVDRV